MAAADTYMQLLHHRIATLVATAPAARGTQLQLVHFVQLRGAPQQLLEATMCSTCMLPHLLQVVLPQQLGPPVGLPAAVEQREEEQLAVAPLGFAQG